MFRVMAMCRHGSVHIAEAEKPGIEVPNGLGLSDLDADKRLRPSNDSPEVYHGVPERKANKCGITITFVLPCVVLYSRPVGLGKHK